MANDGFALSPISASAALPSDADYQAISDAFMETTRGRWFLAEYARRNRNADTTMVLDAVTRLETAIAAQKPAPPPVAPVDKLSEILAQASAAAADVIDRFSAGDSFAPTLRGLRIIREVAWRLREVGYDSRICDILETQADAISANQGPALIQAVRADLLDAIAGIARQADKPEEESLAATPEPAAEGNSAPETAEPPVAMPEAAAEDNSAPATAAPLFAEPANDDSEAASSAPPPSPATVAEVPATEEQPEPVPSPLHAVAAQMQAAATASWSEPAEAGPEPRPPPALRVAAAHAMAAMPVDAISEEVVPAAAHTQAVAVPLPEPAPAEPLSLGASLLARGMVAQPAAAKADPLAPFRRMSQAEKVAFFS